MPIVAAWAAPPAAAPAGPLVRFIDVNDNGNNVDISIEFACSMRYVANNPASHGVSTMITLRPGTDCGNPLGVFQPELPLVGGGGELVTGARLDSLVPGEVTLELDWSRPLDFVMVPTASGLGLRVRLLTSHRRGSVQASEPQPPAGFSVNLDSSQAPIARDAVEAAAARLQTQVYVSEADIEAEHWFRLRAGPFATRQEADRVLKIALADYPRAWLAVNDETLDLSVVERAGAASMATAGATDAPLPDATRAQILADAHTALEKHRYPEAVDLLNRLLRQPEYPARAEAQEMLGLTRERAGQLAQAKAEYEEYLRRYPNGAGAERVRDRLRTLIAASIAPKSTGDFGAAANQRFTLAGSAALSYQYGRDTTVAAGTSTTTNSIDSVLVYGDFLMRDRGARYDFTGRVDGGYTENLVSTPGGSQNRTTAAYAELTDKNFGLTGRLGRQSLASQGVIGLFDGLYVGYQANPRWTVSVAAGLPAYTSYSVISASEKFGTVTAEFDPFHQAWVFDAYVFDETNDIGTERRSIGLQTRYSQLGRTAVVLVDYDLYFKQLNSVTVIGNARLGQNWVLGFDADHRRSPLLELSNALIGVGVQDLKGLESAFQFTPSQIRELAVARTATSNTFFLSASRSFGERWQFMADIGAIQLGATEASPANPATQFPGVDATPSTGLDKNASVQVSGSSLLQGGDLHIFSLRLDDSPSARSTTVSWDARFVVHGAWRLGPRLAVEQLNDPQLGGKQTLYLPQLRGDWTSRRSVFEATAGYEIENQQALQQQQSLSGVAVGSAIEQRSLYISLAYRLRF
jgi:hypothetical protein